MKGKPGCASFRGDCPPFRYCAKFYPHALWVRYHVPMILLGLWCCNITQQVCTQGLPGESTGAGGMGECLGNCGMHLLNCERTENNLFSDPSAVTTSLCACSSLPHNHLGTVNNGPAFESVAMQRSQDDSSQHQPALMIYEPGL